MDITYEVNLINQIKESQTKQGIILDKISAYIKGIEKSLSESVPDTEFQVRFKLNDNQVIKLGWVMTNEKMRLCSAQKEYTGQDYCGEPIFDWIFRPLIEQPISQRLEVSTCLIDFLKKFAESEGEAKTSQYQDYYTNITGWIDEEAGISI